MPTQKPRDIAKDKSTKIPMGQCRSKRDCSNAHNENRDIERNVKNEVHVQNPSTDIVGFERSQGRECGSVSESEGPKVTEILENDSACITREKSKVTEIPENNRVTQREESKTTEIPEKSVTVENFRNFSQDDKNEYYEKRESNEEQNDGNHSNSQESDRQTDAAKGSEEPTKKNSVTTSGVKLRGFRSSSEDASKSGGNNDEPNESISSDICMDHDGETMIMFCSDCRLSVCSECIRTKHKEHEWVQLHKVAIEMRKKLAQYKNNINKTILPNLAACLDKKRAEKERVRNQMMKKMEEIVAQRDKIIATVSGQSQAMLNSCEKEFKVNESTIDKMESDVAVMELLASKLEDATLNCASAAETVQMEARLSSILLKTEPHEMAFNTNINFIPGEIDTGQIKIMLGKLTGLEDEIAEHADNTPDQEVAITSSRSPRRPLQPLNDFQKCVQCKRVVKNVIKVKYMCGHKICNYCWFVSMNSTRCPKCNTL
jgi:hypothetical protein